MTKTTKEKPSIPTLNTNLHNIFATNIAKEEEGAWVTVNDLLGLKVKIRRLRSDASLKAYDAIVRELIGEGAVRKPADMTQAQNEEILKEQLARGVLVDWKGLRDNDTNEEIPYSVETARALMEMRDFRDFVLQASSERDTFKERSDKEAEGN